MHHVWVSSEMVPMCTGILKTAPISRRQFVQASSLAIAGMGIRSRKIWAAEPSLAAPLAEFGYGDVDISSEAHEAQLMNTHSVLMALSEDSILKPFRQMSGMPAPGEDLGGWYNYDPDYDYRKGFDEGFAPGCTFGQWISALARVYAITGEVATREKVLRLNRLYAETITPDFYIKNRFPAYTYDKLLLGLLDSHTHVKDPQALAILEHTTNTALPHLPGRAIEHDHPWRTDKDPADASWTWDESYTMPENLFLAYHRGAGRRYYDLGLQYLDDKTWFDPLSRNEDVMGGRHAYSYVNSLSSAMMAYMVAGSEKHLQAAKKAFAMLDAQSFATGGWGPDETLRAPGSSGVYDSLTNTHHSFETPCGSYAHFKLTRYLLRVTRDSRYGDSMELVMYNTILGAKPLLADGSTFYYSDYNFQGQKIYKDARWPCCSGTLPQVAADYRINTYFSDPDGLYVNLYIPSTVRWTQGGAPVSLTQKGSYPFDGVLKFEITVSKATDFAIHLRIPAWAEGASIFANGKPVPESVVPGKFVTVRRPWKNGDLIEMNLPMRLRLEAIDTHHPQTVALLCGPLVLFAITDVAPAVTARQLLTAKKTGQGSWQVETDRGPMGMLPFIAIEDQHYSTYLVVK